MNHHNSREARGHAGEPENRRRPWSRRLWVRFGAVFGILVVAVVLFVLLFGNAVLNRYGKERIETAFAEARPGHALRIGELNYAAGVNRLVAGTVTWTAPHSTFQVERMTLTGVRWGRLLRGSPWPEVIARASLDAAQVDIELSRSNYGIRCERVRASVPDSDLVVEAIELWPLVEDEAFFAARDYRTTRFHLVLPEGRVSGLSYRELLRGTAYRAGSVQLTGPSFEALVNRDKPEPPVEKRPLMVHEALAGIGRPLQVEELSIRDGQVAYSEQTIAGAEPGVLTFGSVRLFVHGIANENGGSEAIEIQGQGDLMNAGTLAIEMSIPIQATDFSLQYSGTLSAMDLRSLDPFLGVAEQLRIRSGHVREAMFDIDVTAGEARGFVHAVYEDLGIALVGERAEGRNRVDRRLVSFFMNLMKIRESNEPETTDPMKTGEVNYSREPEDTFLEFVWFALRSGVLDVISL